MKNYKEMADSVFERRDKYYAERRMAMNKMKKSIAGAACCCLVALLGIGIWQVGRQSFSPKTSEQLRNEADTIFEQNANNPQESVNSWVSANEILEASEDSQRFGVSVPLFVAYQGEIYGYVGVENNDNSKYALLEEKIILRKNYSYPAYQIKDTTDCVAIVINGKLMIYKKLFDINLVINDTPYKIVHNTLVEYSIGEIVYNSSLEYSRGEIVQKNDDYTVYQIIKTHTGEVVDDEYIVDLLPIFKEKLPNLFSGEEVYGDVFWVAMPEDNS